MDTAALRAAFTGPLIFPGDPGYDEARRIWNGMHDRRPALIARPLGAADASAAIRYASGAGLPVTVRGGGHNVAGTSIADEAVLIDLSLLREVTVDPEAETAEAGGGALLKDVDSATAPHDLGCPSGVVGHTGLAGLAIGGGYGWITRKWGLTCDHILGAEVVLADGSIVQASETEHQDLLWALRGSAGNFGVVTRFTLRLRPVGPILYRTALYPLKDAPAALRAFREFTVKQSDDLRVFGSFQFAGDGEAIPAELRGEPILELAVACSADVPESVVQSAEIYASVPPAAQAEETISYYDLQSKLNEAAPAGRRYFTKACYLTDLTDGVLERIVEAARANPSGLSSIDVEYLRGAITDVDPATSAFPHREAPFFLAAWASWTDPAHDGENIAWSRGTVASLEEWHYEGSYANYAPEDDESAPAGDPRLPRVKHTYDPGNLFRGERHAAPADV